jgi:hypothetical protein
MNKVEGSNIKLCRKRDWQILTGMKENNKLKKQKEEKKEWKRNLRDEHDSWGYILWLSFLKLLYL